MRLVYLPEAREDLLDAVTFYHEREEGLAADFYQEFEQAEREIIEWPELWSQFEGNYRRKIINRFPNSIIYHQIGEELWEVVAVVPQKGDPKELIERLR